MITLAESASYKPLPQRIVELKDFTLPEDLWSDFLIPVNMTFFVFNTKVSGTVAYYPAPTGATESKLKLEPWFEMVRLNPVLQSLMPDLEALLVNRLNKPGKYFIVPIDTCYKLIGKIRTSWKGISGGVEVNHIIDQFFNQLKESSECPI
jgi:hypothetical protein